MCDSMDQNSDSSHREQLWEAGEEEVTSCVSEDGPFQQQQHEHATPLHRVKRVWSHLCFLEQLDDPCFDH